MEKATINIKETQMSDDRAHMILQHMIKYQYEIKEFTRFKDSLMDYPEYTIYGSRPFVIYPQSPLIDIFNKALDVLIESGKVQIEIDQCLGAIDISISREKNT